MRLDKTDILIKPIVGKVGALQVITPNQTPIYNKISWSRNGYGINLDPNGYYTLANRNEPTIRYYNSYPYQYIEGVFSHYSTQAQQILYPYSLEKSYWNKQGLTVETGLKSPFKNNGEIVMCGRKLNVSTVNEEHYLSINNLPVFYPTSYYYAQIALNVQKNDKYNMRIEITMHKTDGTTYFRALNYDLSTFYRSYNNTPPIEPLADNFYRVFNYGDYIYPNATSVDIKIFITDKSYNKTFTGDGDGVTFAGIEFRTGGPKFTPFLFPTLNEGSVISKAVEYGVYSNDIIQNITLGDYAIYVDIDFNKDFKERINYPETGAFLLGPSHNYIDSTSEGICIRLSNQARIDQVLSYYVNIPYTTYYRVYPPTPQKYKRYYRFVLKFDSAEKKVKAFSSVGVSEKDYVPALMSSNNLYIGSGIESFPFGFKEFRIMHGLTDDECQTLAKKGFIHD